MDEPVPLRRRLADRFWERHANPKSGWSRFLLGPALLAALYRRDGRLLALVLLATVLNPIAFPARDGEGPDSWATRAVLAERWWLNEGNGTVGLEWPNALNALNVPTFAYALASAYRRRPARAAVTLACSMALKVGWIEAIARRYDAAVRGGSADPGVGTRHAHNGHE